MAIKTTGEITITAKRDGFRRCGVAHKGTPVTWPAGSFTEAQISELKAEQMLVVWKGSQDPSSDDDGQVSKLQSQLNALQAKHDGLVTGNSNLQEQVESLTDDNMTLQGRIDSLTEESQTLQASVDSLTAEKAELQKQVDELTKAKTK